MSTWYLPEDQPVFLVERSGRLVVRESPANDDSPWPPVAEAQPKSSTRPGRTAWSECSHAEGRQCDNCK